MTVHDPDADCLARLREENRLVEEAIRAAVREATIVHKRLGQPMVVWRDGKIVWIPAEELTIDDPADSKGDD